MDATTPGTPYWIAMASRALRRRSTYRALNHHNKHKSRPLLKVAIVTFVALMMLTSGASAGTLFFYGESLPSLRDFTKRFQFENTFIRAADGSILYNLADLSKTRGRRVVEPLIMPGHTTRWYRQHGQYWLAGPGSPGIPVSLQNATIATEDATFYDNPGFDPLSIGRAAIDDLRYRRVVSGASTITQQLIKQYILSSSPSVTRKVAEVILAAELTQKYPKTKILWYYLNSIPYGNQAVGAQAAAQTYFHVPVWKLTPAQSAFLAGLPEAPSTYNPINNLPGAINRMRTVLRLMDERGYLVNSRNQRDPSVIPRYLNEAKRWPRFTTPQSNMRFPHFVRYVIDELNSIPQLKGRVYTGLDVKTTLDPTLQRRAQDIVSGQIAGLGAYNVTDGALVSMKLTPDCYGCILAMVGSANYSGTAGQINMANTPRQPGSSFKPFNYEYAFEHGVGPATTVVDAPISLPDPGNPQDGGYYQPLNYDQEFHGTVTLRMALQNSLNIPAVKVEEYSASQAPGGGSHGPIGASIGDNAVKLGIKSLYADNPNCCGYATTLGGMERGVRLVEETSAFGAFGTLGRPVQPIGIREVRDRRTGKILWSADSMMRSEQQQQVIPAADAYLMDNVLSDNASRCTSVVCDMGTNSPLYLGRPAAAKTGTTTNFTDNWTVGYTPQLVTGVWVGNPDNSPMVGTTGLTGAAPIWNEFMTYAVTALNLPPVDWQAPAGVLYGSTCKAANSFGGYGLASYSYDLYAVTLPWCSIESSIGQTTTTAPAPPPDDQAPQVPVAPAPTLAPTPLPTTPPIQAPATLPPAPIAAPTSAVGTNGAVPPAPASTPIAGSGSGTTP